MVRVAVGAMWWCCAVRASCPEVLELAHTIDGVASSVAFARNASFLGVAFAHLAGWDGLHLADVLGKGCVVGDNLCTAGVVAGYARHEFLAAGHCGSAEMVESQRGVVDILQIGAHVGDSRASSAAEATLDPVFPWLRHAATSSTKAVLVEPVRGSFEQLVANYAGAAARVFFVHAALSAAVALASLHVPLRCADPYARSYMERHIDTVARHGAPRVDGQSEVLCLEGFEVAGLVGSLDRAHVAKHVGEDYADAIATYDVPALTWATLLDSHSASAVGLVVVDAEGRDCALLSAFPYDRLRPDAILFEYSHCDAAEMAALLRTLARNGYRLAYDNGDDVCYVHQAARSAAD